MAPMVWVYKDENETVHWCVWNEYKMRNVVACDSERDISQEEIVYRHLSFVSCSACKEEMDFHPALLLLR